MSILTETPKIQPQIKSEIKPKIAKTRGYMTGQKMTAKQMEDEVVRLSKTNRNFEIQKITGKSKSTIQRILKKAKTSGKILTSQSGRVILPSDELANRKYIEISRNELYEKYPPVKKWVDKRKAEAKGDSVKLKRMTYQLGRLKVVCDTTRLNPYVLLSSGEDGTSYGGLESVMGAFAIAMTEKRVVYQNKKQKQPDADSIDSAYREYLMATRNFATYNGVSLPKFPPEHILSGKKIGFGQYAHVKMTTDEINQCVKFLEKKYGKDSMQVVMFVFYYITGTRALSIYGIKTSTVTVLNNGWLSCMVYESKTRTTWKKYIQNDNPHFEIIQNWFNKRKAESKPFLFSESGKVYQPDHDKLIDSFREMYKFIGLTEEYFFIKPIHALRHVMAHFFLDKTDNHGLVAKLGGWKDIQTLISCYAEMTDETIFRILGAQ